MQFLQTKWKIVCCSKCCHCCYCRCRGMGQTGGVADRVLLVQLPAFNTIFLPTLLLPPTVARGDQSVRGFCFAFDQFVWATHKLRASLFALISARLANKLLRMVEATFLIAFPLGYSGSGREREREAEHWRFAKANLICFSLKCGKQTLPSRGQHF